MKHFILSLLLLSGVVAKAQSKWPTITQGDTTFYLLKNDDVGVVDEFVYNMESMGLTMIHGFTYSLYFNETDSMVYGYPLEYQNPQIGVSYPYEKHVYNYDYRNTEAHKAVMRKSLTVFGRKYD